MEGTVLTTLVVFERTVVITRDSAGMISANFDAGDGVYSLGPFQSSPDNLEKLLHDSCSAMMSEWIKSITNTKSEERGLLS